MRGCAARAEGVNEEELFVAPLLGKSIHTETNINEHNVTTNSQAYFGRHWIQQGEGSSVQLAVAYGVYGTTNLAATVALLAIQVCYLAAAPSSAQCQHNANMGTS